MACPARPVPRRAWPLLGRVGVAHPGNDLPAEMGRRGRAWGRVPHLTHEGLTLASLTPWTFKGVLRSLSSVVMGSQLETPLKVLVPPGLDLPELPELPQLAIDHQLRVLCVASRSV